MVCTCLDMEWQIGPGEMSEKAPHDQEASFQSNNEVDIGMYLRSTESLKSFMYMYYY